MQVQYLMIRQFESIYSESIKNHTIDIFRTVLGAIGNWYKNHQTIPYSRKKWSEEKTGI